MDIQIHEINVLKMKPICVPTNCLKTFCSITWFSLQHYSHHAIYGQLIHQSTRHLGKVEEVKDKEVEKRYCNGKTFLLLVIIVYYYNNTLPWSLENSNFHAIFVNRKFDTNLQ